MSEQNQKQNTKYKTTKQTAAVCTENPTETAILPDRAQREHTSTWGKWLSKKWVFPALYMTTVAIILTLVWGYQDSNLRQETKPMEQTEGSSTGNTDMPMSKEEASEVVATNETIAWPVANANDVEVVKPFFDDKASKEEQTAAIVQYKQTFMPNAGIDLARKDQKEFDVLAVMGGKVIRAEQHATNGHVVEVEHGNGMKTIYQSLADVKVTAGDTVKKGDLLAVAGRNELEKELGVHLHFEVYQADKPVNPISLLAKKE